MAAAISPMGIRRSVRPASASARGIPYTTQVDSASARTVPPWALMALAPSSPSRPIPVSTTPMARGPKTAASDRNNSSTEGRTPWRGGWSVKRIRNTPGQPRSTTRCRPPGAR